MKIKIPLVIGFGAAFAVGCQKDPSVPIEYSSIGAALEDNIGKPYSCTIQRTARIQISDSGTIGQVVLKSKNLYHNEGESYAFREVSPTWIPKFTSFTRRESGLEHTIREAMPGADEEWHCDLWEQGIYPLGIDGVFPKGGWSIVAQVDTLLQLLGPTKAEVSRGIARVSWPEIPESVRIEMLSQYGVYDREPNGKEEIRLEINLAQGTPVSIGLYFGQGESVVNTFTDFAFPLEDIQLLATRLKSEFLVPETYQCKCDFSSPNTRVSKRAAASVR